MEIRKINDNLFVAGQISPADIPQLASHGIQTIVCNRPDGEDEGQPEFALIDSIAKASGITMKYLPVVSGSVTDNDVSDFSNAIDQTIEAEKLPVLAYCRTGTRCTILWALSEGKKGASLQQILDTAAQAGYNLSGQIPRLQENGAS